MNNINIRFINLKNRVVFKAKTKYYTYRPKIKKIFNIKNVAAFLLSFASIIISVVGIRIEKNTQMVAEKELEILENDREAYFCLVENYTDEIKNDTNTGYVTKYTIYNKGGRISGACIMPMSYFDFYVYDNDEGVYTRNKKSYRLALWGYSYGTYSDVWYNTKSNSFSFNLYYSSQLDDFANMIALYAEEPCKHFVYFERLDLIEIQYCNYENIRKNVTFNIYKDSLDIVDDAENEFEYIHFNVNDYSEDEAKEIAKIIAMNYINESSTQ